MTPLPSLLIFGFQVNGLKEGDYIVAVGDSDCKAMSVSQVIGLLKDVGEEGVDLRVVSLMDSIASMVSPAPSNTFAPPIGAV